MTAREKSAENGKTRRYYHLTEAGGRALKDKTAAWETYTEAVGRVLKGGVCFG